MLVGGELRFLDFQGGSSSCLMRPHEVLPHVLILVGDHISVLSVQFSCSDMSDSLGPHEPQHARLPCQSPTPRACSDSCMSIKCVMPSNCLILCRPLLLLPSTFPRTQINITWIFVQYISEYVHNICFRIFRIFVFEHVQDIFSSAFT